MVDEMLGESWDLAEVLAERAQPEDSVEIFLSEALSYAKAKLMKNKPGPKAPISAVDSWEASLAEIDAELDAKKYTVNLRGIGPEERKRISDEALAEVPYKTNFLGQDDPQNAAARFAVEDALLWEAQVVSVTNPDGKVKRDWDKESLAMFADKIPVASRKAINEAIQQLNKLSDEFTARSKSPDF